MSSIKRAAGRELNHDNWNEDEDEEEVGEFKRASEEVLKQRQIKVAKRRMPDSGDGAPKANPFSGFGGFGSTGNNTFSTSTPAVGGTASSSPFGFLSNLASSTTAPALTTGSSAAPKTNGTSNLSDKVTFHAKVKELNNAFVAWISKNLAEDAIVDLTPVFKSYEENLKSLKDAKLSTTETSSVSAPAKASNDTEKKTFSFGAPKAATNAAPPATTASSGSFSSFKFGSGASTEPEKAKTDVTKSPAAPATGFGSFTGFGSTTEPPKSTAASATSTFSFGLPKPTSSPASTDTSKNLTASNTSSFSFGFTKPDAAGDVTSAPSSTFSFGLKATSTSVFGGLNPAAPTFSFGNVTQVSQPGESSSSTAAAEEETEEPPKNEFVPVVEDDSLYSKRCKVFVKNGPDFADRGVGTLYIKKVDEKIQMLVRADTNLGNILLNIMLASGLPASRMGKNNVMLVCIPTPDAKPPPTSVLLRVKNGEEADELLEMIKKHKMSE